MKYREEAQSRSHESLQTENRSLALTNAPSTNPSSSLMSTSIRNPPPTSTMISTNAFTAPSIAPYPRRYINPLSLRFSIINPKEVEILPPVESHHVKPTHQPILHSPPRSLAQIRVITPNQIPIASTQQSIMSEALQQPTMTEDPDAVQQADSAPSQPIVEFREIIFNFYDSI